MWVVRAGVTQTGLCYLPDLNYAQMVDGCRLRCASSAVSTVRGLARLLRHRSWCVTQAAGHVALGNMGASAALAWQTHGWDLCFAATAQSAACTDGDGCRMLGASGNSSAAMALSSSAKSSAMNDSSSRLTRC